MNEDVKVTTADTTTAPDQDVTANSGSEVSTPAVVENQPDPKPADKLYTQAEIDAMIGKRLAREQRKWEREQSAKLAEGQTHQVVPAEVPSADQFETPEAYAEAVAERRAQQLVAQRDAAKRDSEIMEAYHDREEEIRTKYEDFDQVAYSRNLPVTSVMAETIRASEIGPEVIYHLGLNPKEAERISRLTPFLQAKEIGRIEAKLAADPPAKKTSSAPTPINPVSPRGPISPVTDTTDPRSTKTMSTSQWIEAERNRQIAKQKAQRQR